MTAASLRRAVLPATVFLVVAAFHYLWLGVFPEQDPAQSQWVAVDAERSWLQSYLEGQGYWLSFSYALSLSFAAVALRRYREQRSCGVRNLAIGGVTFSGFLAVAGCYLIGCCGSPMLVVYLNLFGAAFVPLAKPLVAAMTTVSIAGAWWWMNRRRQPRAVTPASGVSPRDAACDTE